MRNSQTSAAWNRDPYSSGVLPRAEWYLPTDVSGKKYRFHLQEPVNELKNSWTF